MELSNPTSEPSQLDEIKLNDSRILKKRTVALNSDLVKNLEILSFVLIIISYLNTLSLIDFAIRLSQQLVITKPFPKGSTEMRMMSENVKKLISRSIFQVLVVINVGMVLIHLLFGSNVSSKPNSFSHGGWTLQIIGEAQFQSWFCYKIFILANDLAIFLLHSSICFITCLKNEGLIKEEHAARVEEVQEQVYDGYCGNVTVVELDPRVLLTQMSQIKRDHDAAASSATTESTETSTFEMPGGFQVLTNFSVNDLV